MSPRDERLIAHYRSGGSLRSTGAAFGLTYQGVKWVLSQHDVPCHPRGYRIDDRDADAEVEAAARAIYRVLCPGAPWGKTFKATHERYRAAARAALGRTP